MTAGLLAAIHASAALGTPDSMSRVMTVKWAEKRVLWLAAILLAAVAGYVDGYGLLFLKTYVSFMSGKHDKHWCCKWAG